MVWQYMAEQLWPADHPYHHTTIGDPKDIEGATLDEVRVFYQQYYVPANAVVTIAGDFDEQETKRLVEMYFGHIPGGVRAPKPEGGIPKLTKLVHVEQTDDVKLPRLYLAWPTPPLYAPGDAELDILANVLTRGKTSRLFQPLVYEKKVAKDVAAFQASQMLASYFVVMVTAAPGTTIEQLHRETMAALRDALESPPTDAELGAAVNHFKKDYYSRMEGVIERAGLFSTYYHHTGKADYLAQDVERYLRATPASVQGVAQKWLDLDHHVRIDILPGVKAGGAE
jgi:zinc protease